MPLPNSMAVDDFRALRERGMPYVDKSDLIRQLIEQRGILVPRLLWPRGTGKSVCLSMLRWFFEKRDEDVTHLFADLAIWRAGDVYRQHFQRYPVIYLDFQDLRPATVAAFQDQIRARIREVFVYHRVVLDSGTLDAITAEDYRAILDGSAHTVQYRRALMTLSKCLQEYHGERVLILIDDYDAPMYPDDRHEAVARVENFLAGFYGYGLKGNDLNLHQAVVMGIPRADPNPYAQPKWKGFWVLPNNVYNARPDGRFACALTAAELAALKDRAGQP